MALLNALIPHQRQNPQKLSSYSLVKYLIEHPNEKGEFEFRAMCPRAWVNLLSERPDFIGRCDIKELAWSDVADILMAQPDLSPQLPIRKIPSFRWVDILIEQPTLAEECKCWSKFTSSDLKRLLIKHPQFAVKCNLQKIKSDDWGELLEHQIQFADKCPWEKLKFSYTYWFHCIINHSEIILEYRSDWKKYLDPSAYKRHLLWLMRFDPALVFIRSPQKATKENLKLHPLHWKRLLAEQPKLAKFCDFKKMFQNPPLDLIAKQPELVTYFNWESANLPENAITELIKTQPQLEKLMIPFFYAKHWEKALFDTPTYLLQRDGRRFSFVENTRALVAADFLIFSDNGLDSLCNMFYKKVELQKSDPDGIFKDITECDAATWLIYNQIDSTNGQKYLKRQLQLKNWNFIENIYDLDAKEIINLLGKENLPFLITLDASDNFFYKFVNSESLRKNYRNGEDELFSFFQSDNIISTIADENGNTLLHAALLYATYADVYSVIDTSNQYCARYNYLIEQGCDPDKKNNLGFSCNDLIVDIKKRIRELERSS